MQTRRNFIGNVATGLAGTFIGTSGRVRIGVIGVGERGTQLAREAAACPHAELVSFADVYTRRLEEAKNLAAHATMHQDYRRLLEDKSVDAVIIATPQHLHADAFVAALDAGKHVYQEKTMAFTVDDAKRMRTAYLQAPARVVQIGHQGLSSGHVTDASNYLASGALGQITAIQAHMYRNTPHGKPQWARPVYPDMSEATIAWQSFLGGAPERPFDANRYANWRYFWDYSGGNVHENMCHQIAFWHKVMHLGIPARVNMSGGIYLWKDGREVPDTMSVSMEHEDANRQLLFTWNSGFGNNSPGVTEEVLGTDGSILKGQQIRFQPQKVNRPDLAEVLGQTPTQPRAHMQNFVDAVRSGKAVNCPFEVGYSVSVTCHMAVESYLQGRSIGWDEQREEMI